MRVDSRRLGVIGFTQGKTRGFYRSRQTMGIIRRSMDTRFDFAVSKESISRGLMFGFNGFVGESSVLRSDHKMGRTCEARSFSYTRMLRKEVEVVIFFTWWDLVRISWILVRICPEQEHDYSHLIVINDSKAPGKGTLRLFELYHDLLDGELGGLISFNRSVAFLFGIFQLDCDVDLIKLSASGGNRKMRSMLLKQGGINLLIGTSGRSMGLDKCRGYYQASLVLV
ncbi:LOW QUALITY PROTEIN: hypothetical protein HID58_070567 [Brassica napus]|uniref:Uncharacterized protein n=1 Tax=Brassica napus TaxID=3708 RepID=A0ABQ7YZ72_BRANA|nr:LOW QUALITY PROTEIN: hypothetical protein HID58_070567 [Brassica napus]